jgi:hypothetical protein
VTGRAFGYRRVAFLLGVAILSSVAVLIPSPASAAPSSSDVTMTVLRVNPSAPLPINGSRLLTITLSLDNNTDLPIRKLVVTADRGDPITDQLHLNASLNGGSESSHPVSVSPPHPVTVNLAPDETHHLVFYRFTTGIPTTNDLCLCADAIYPIDLSARVRAVGTVKTVATTRTWIPSFDTPHRPVQVSWVWPLIDRPHRIGDGSMFIDDDLANEVATDGRLDRALRVVQRVGPSVPITLVVDPELLDELQVMSTGKYTVRTSAKATAPGTGQAAATNWLRRFQRVIGDAEVTVDLIPYADPDIQTLASNGLRWSDAMPHAMARRVSLVLGDTSVETTVSWPAGGAIGQPALDRIVEGGAATVILDRASIAPKEINGIPASLARLHSSAGTVTAALTSPAIQAYVRSTVTMGGPGAATLPQLVSEIAVRVDPTEPVKQQNLGHVVVLTPPRYVNPAPAMAARAILQTTSQSSFSEGIALDEATSSSLVPKTVSHLRDIAATAAALPSDLLGQARYAASSLAPVTALLSKSRPAQRIVAALPWQLQQSESSGWRTDAEAVGGPAIGEQLVTHLRRQVEAIVGSVRILKQSKSSGSYTLASSKAMLPLTVQNTSRFVLLVHIDVRAQKGIPGFRHYSGNVSIQPDRKQTVKIPTEVDRSGRIPISVQLSTPGVHGAPGEPLGDAIALNVHSTALGAIGVVITVGAGAVLVLALLIRYVRRIKRIRTKRRKGAAARQKTPSAQREPA